LRWFTTVWCFTLRPAAIDEYFDRRIEACHLLGDPRSVAARVMRGAIAESDAHAPDSVRAFEFYLERKTRNPALGA